MIPYYGILGKEREAQCLKLIAKFETYSIFDEFPNGAIVYVFGVVNNGYCLVKCGIDRLVGIMESGVLVV